MTIRNAEERDIARIMELYDIGRAYQIANGNPTQWPVGFPALETVQTDVRLGQNYVWEEDGIVHGVFAFIGGEEPTYQTIDGTWKNDTPYYTIHRAASDGTVRGFGDAMMRWCQEKADCIRIDTHALNYSMQHVILKNGFSYCGIILAEDGTERLAYQWDRNR